MQRSTSTTGCPVAAPQCISGRTSYLHVRLAFHPYPQLIPQFCNTGEFGPRRPFTAASPWPWIAHVVSGPIAGEWPLTACEYEVSGTLSSPSRGAFHLSLTVLVHYRSLKVFSLGGWSPLLPTNSPGFVVLRIPARVGSRSPTGLSPAAAARSNAFGSACFPCCWSYNPCLSRKTHRFGLFPPRSPLLRESRLISLRRATEMFQFAHYPPSCLWYSAGGVQTSLWTGCPIRNLRAHRSHAAPPERFAGLRVLLRPSAPRHPPRTLSRLCSPGSLLLPRTSHATPRDLSSRHTHTRVSSASRSLSSCLGNIEVIVIYFCNAVVK